MVSTNVVAAGLGKNELHVGVVGLQLHDVTRIGLSDNEIARRQVVERNRCR